MIDSSVYLYVYALAWIVEFAVYYWKTKSIGVGGVLIITYTISSLTSIFFLNNMDDLFDTGDDLAAGPLIYLFLCLNIMICPIFVHSKRLGTLPIKVSGTYFLYVFLIICSPFIIESFFEISLISSSTNTNSLGSIYESDADTIGNQLSWLGRKTTAIVGWFLYLWPILFFILYQKGGKYRRVSYFAILAFLTSMLRDYAAASRVGIVRAMMYFFLVFMLYKYNISRKNRKKIEIAFGIGGGSLILLLAIITISRFSYSGSGDITSVWVWVSLYIGEAPIRFCQYMWTITTTGNGDNTFSLLKEVLGLNPIIDMEQRRAFYEAKLGIPNNIFYTIIGDFYVDLGRVGTLVYCVCYSFLLNLYIKYIINKRYLSLSSFFILSLILLSSEFGIMYFAFKLYMIQVYLVPSFVLLVVYYLFTNKRTKTVRVRYSKNKKYLSEYKVK